MASSPRTVKQSEVLDHHFDPIDGVPAGRCKLSRQGSPAASGQGVCDHRTVLPSRSPAFARFDLFPGPLVIRAVLFVVVFLIRMTAGAVACAEDKPPEAPASFTHQITGLFSPDRVDDLKETMKHLPEIVLVKVDYERAEATFRYDPAKAFPGAKPDQIVERFDQILRNESNHTFGIKPLCELPADKLTILEIPVGGLDCKGCAFGAYDSIYRLPGVERATVSFKKGQLKAVINPEKVDRVVLETALKQRGVEIKPKSTVSER